MSAPDPYDDMDKRMAPSAKDIELAQVLLRNDGWGSRVLTPIAFPRKYMGLWTVDQEVVTPGGLFPCDDDTSSFEKARRKACRAAAAALNGRCGTIGYVVHTAGDQWAVFEDIMRPHYLELEDVK